MLFVVTDCQLRDEAADGIENRVQSVAVAGQDHPCCKRSCAFLAEGVETLVDDHPRIRLPGPCSLNGFGDAAVHRVRNRLDERSLETGSGPEMVKQVGMGAPDFRRYRFQRYRLRSLVEQQPARRCKRGGAAFLWGKAGSFY